MRPRRSWLCWLILAGTIAVFFLWPGVWTMGSVGAALILMAVCCFRSAHEDKHTCGPAARPVDRPLLTRLSPVLEVSSRKRVGMPIGHPEWITGHLPPELEATLTRLSGRLWPQAEYLGITHDWEGT